LGSASFAAVCQWLTLPDPSAIKTLRALHIVVENYVRALIPQ
jgi:hypothetical protein